jgi:RNA polymerase sigma-70 factor (ECF subfamily)
VVSDHSSAFQLDLSDPLVFRQAFDEHERRVFTTALGVLGDPARAQDVVQDVFLRVWRRPGAFDPARGELGLYLRLIARSRALDVLRESGAAGRADERLRRAPEPDGDANPALALEQSDDAERVRAAVGRLPPPQREAVVLTYWCGLTAEQVARRTGAPVGTAKSRIRLGLRRLRVEFDRLAPAC